MGSGTKASNRKGRESKLQNVVFCLNDWQKFFVHPESPAFIPETSRIIEDLSEFLRHFSESGYPIVFTQHRNSASIHNSFLRFYGRLLSESSCWFGLAEPAAGFKKARVFYKETYSVFANRDFAAYLKANDIRTMVLAGVQTDKCILANALSGFDLGYEIIVAADICASRNKFRHRAALNLMKASCARVLRTDELLKLLKP